MISVVVPMYNVEKYIENCLKSLLTQKYSDYEIVLVNDGTPDRSAEFANATLASQDKIPYRIITTENRGVSSARNTGIEHAHGDYIVMVDADDIVSPDFLSDFAKLIDKYCDADIFSCGFTVVNEENAKVFDRKESTEHCLSREDAQIHFFNRTIKFLLPTLLLSRTFISRNGIRFDEGVRYSEDVQFIWRCLAYNQKQVIHLPALNYNYILHPGSTMTASGVEKILTCCGGIDRLVTETKLLYCEPVRSQLGSKMYFSMLHGASRMLRYNDFLSLYNRANCKAHIVNQLGSAQSIKVKVVCLLVLLSRRLGFELMKRK